VERLSLRAWFARFAGGQASFRYWGKSSGRVHCILLLCTTEVKGKAVGDQKKTISTLQFAFASREAHLIRVVRKITAG